MLKKMRRGAHFDFHTMPGIDNFGENFDAARFAEMMEKANVGYVNFFGRCNAGFSYYKTKVGVEYPGMRGNMLADVVRECHKRGIPVTGYVNAGLHHELSRVHYDWLNVTKDGKVYDFTAPKAASFFRNVCFNTPYRDHLLAEIKEILDLGVDGIFCDCMSWRPCYCANCIRDMLAEGIDINDDAAVLEFGYRTREKMCADIRAIVPRDKRLFMNDIRQRHNLGFSSHYEIECLWSYGYFEPHAAYARPYYDTVLYMNGRFQEAWGDFGGYKGKVAVESDFYDALTQGAIPMLGDHLHPARLPEEKIYRDLGEIYEKIKAYEPWTDGAKYVSEVAVVTAEKVLGDIQLGAAKMLCELKVGFDIIDTDANLSKYRIIILPEDVVVEDVLKENLAKYLADGGKVISVGCAGVNPDGRGFALPEWDFEYLGTDTSDAPYFRLCEKSSELADMDFSVYHAGILMRAENGVLADRVRPYYDKKGWDGRHMYRYDPPKSKDGCAAAAINSSGNLAHIAFPIFADFLKIHPKAYRELVRSIIKKLMPDGQLRAESMPSCSRVTVTEGDGYKLLHVKVTYPEVLEERGTLEEHTELFGGRVVGVLGEYKSVSRLPDEKTIHFEVSDGYTYITLPDIKGYDMFLLK